MEKTDEYKKLENELICALHSWRPDKERIKQLKKELKVLYKKLTKNPKLTVNCEFCKDSKEIEVIVMGTDTEYVECFYCSNKPTFVEFSDSSFKEDCIEK